ncbi:MAG: hypothetical protein R3208_09900, partial [Ketobacteraceae bacterium]|nr:hypothetical protein [Ketobacteraceae bacterium]
MGKLKWAMGILTVLVVLVLGAGLHGIWPFIRYPVTEVTIRKASALPPESHDTLLAGVAVRDITTPIGITKMG